MKKAEPNGNWTTSPVLCGHEMNRRSAASRDREARSSATDFVIRRLILRRPLKRLGLDQSASGLPGVKTAFEARVRS
jgi:hypothetical protein